MSARGDEITFGGIERTLGVDLRSGERQRMLNRPDKHWGQTGRDEYILSLVTSPRFADQMKAELSGNIWALDEAEQAADRVWQKSAAYRAVVEESPRSLDLSALFGQIPSGRFPAVVPGTGDRIRSVREHMAAQPWFADLVHGLSACRGVNVLSEIRRLRRSVNRAYTDAMTGMSRDSAYGATVADNPLAVRLRSLERFSVLCAGAPDTKTVANKTAAVAVIALAARGHWYAAARAATLLRGCDWSGRSATARARPPRRAGAVARAVAEFSK